MSHYGSKFRLIGALEREDIPLLARLIQIKNHDPISPVDKMENNLLHLACYLGKINTLDFLTGQLRIGVNRKNRYNKQSCVHCAVKGMHYNIVVWLWEHGAD